MKNNVKLLLMFWILHGVFSYLFFDTSGLVYIDRDSPLGFSYVEDLHSSGGNDNISIETGIVFSIFGALFSILRFGKAFGVIDLGFHGVLLFFQAVLVVTIEVGSIVHTILDAKNIVLLFWMISYLSLCAIFLLEVQTAIHRKLNNRI